MRCSECGAPVEAGAGRACPHCGAVLPGAERVEPYEYMVHDERFDAVEQHADYPAAMQHVPQVRSGLGITLAVVFAGIGLGFFGFTNAMVQGDLGAPVAFRLMWMAITGMFVAITLYMVYRTVRFHRAPVQRRIAVVVDERTHVSGSKNSTRTAYHATLQVRGGQRLELECDARTAGEITRGDIGVAQSKLDKLVGFRRISC